MTIFKKVQNSAENTVRIFSWILFLAYFVFGEIAAFNASKTYSYDWYSGYADHSFNVGTFLLLTLVVILVSFLLFSFLTFFINMGCNIKRIRQIMEWKNGLTDMNADGDADGDGDADTATTEFPTNIPQKD